MNDEQGESPYQQGYNFLGKVPWGEDEADYCPYYVFSKEGKDWLEGYIDASIKWYDDAWAE